MLVGSSVHATMCQVPNKANPRSFTPTHISFSIFLKSSSSTMEDKPNLEEHETKQPQTLSSSNSVRKISNDPNSPEFEFWMVRNPSFPQPHLLSADELIVDGVLLPLHLISQDPKPNSVSLGLEHETESEPSQAGPEPESSTVSSSSKRWRDIFKMGEKKNEDKKRNREKEKKKERKSNGNNSNMSSAAELNINIWPFSRSWSAGNRPKLSNGTVSRKVSSAPCSRSNSAGESKSRKWPNSPSRGGGIHLGRKAPVWQVRPGGSGLRNTEPVFWNVDKTGVREEGLRSKNINNGGDVGASKGRVLNLNLPVCIGYRQQLSCRADENVFIGGGGGGGAENGGASVNDGTVGGSTKLFNLRNLFTKKISVN